MLDAESIANAAAAGGADAINVLTAYEDRLVRSLSGVINIWDSDVIVLGGGVSNVQRLYQQVPPAFAQHVFSDRVTTPIVPAKHGDSSGVRGAAWLWPSAGANADDGSP